MKVVFNERAIEDLGSIYLFIAADSPQTARAVVDRIVASVERLANFPEMACKGRADGTREWVVPRCLTSPSIRSCMSATKLS
ncbi:MAG: type II toxin-antitoxin system RelE/ParE family toxin [Pseudorhodoplanes sp.]|nr:type II toxin-antitoxin system RelE/ParE family toxin [Pseudorhodoplanes sp.]